EVGDATNTSTSIALSNGDGTFTVVAGPTFPAYPACFAPFPLDGNARTDLVFASQNATGQGEITFEKNTSVGNNISFAALHTTAITTTATSFQPTQILVGDFHDNQSSGTSTAHLDLAVLGTDDNGNGSDDIVIFSGNGDGTFTQAADFTLSASNYGQLLSADYDSNGLADIALFDGNTNLRVLLNHTASPD